MKFEKALQIEVVSQDNKKEGLDEMAGVCHKEEVKMYEEFQANVNKLLFKKFCKFIVFLRAIRSNSCKSVV